MQQVCCLTDRQFPVLPYPEMSVLRLHDRSHFLPPFQNYKKQSYFLYFHHWYLTWQLRALKHPTIMRLQSGNLSSRRESLLLSVLYLPYHTLQDSRRHLFSSEPPPSPVMPHAPVELASSFLYLLKSPPWSWYRSWFLFYHKSSGNLHKYQSVDLSSHRSGSKSIRLLHPYKKPHRCCILKYCPQNLQTLLLPYPLCQQPISHQNSHNGAAP